MAICWKVKILENAVLLHEAELDGPAEFGRQVDSEEGQFATRLANGRWRLVVARVNEPSISRRHLLVEPLSESRARLMNLSHKLPAVLPNGGQLSPLATAEVSLPASLAIGGKTLLLETVAPASTELHGFELATIPPGKFTTPKKDQKVALLSGDNPDLEVIASWLQSVMGVLQSAGSSSDFFDHAAEAMVELAGLDTGRVLLLKDGDWKPQAMYAETESRAARAKPPSQRVLGSLLMQKRTLWEVPAALLSSVSLVGVSAVVAAPILDRRGDVIGALYGDRRSKTLTAKPITKLQAMLVEMIASSVAAGLARMEQEHAAVRARVLFEQFFTPELSRQLEAHPDLLSGRAAEVSVLFCDIRGFSRVSERLGPAGTLDWIGGIMGTLSECVYAHQGVLVDYIGDELLAMWGAPAPCANHAELACRAAIDMLATLPRLNERWLSQVQETIHLGIGISTGQAQVGNVGSIRKFKYGPLGNTVNVASRLQGATRYLKTPLVIAGSTRAQLGDTFALRRLCRARVVNIAEPVDIYELATGNPEWGNVRREFETALTHFENAEFRDATRILGNLLAHHPDDGPVLVLIARAVQALVDTSAPFDPVWNLPGK